jgi:hypothetical protein
MMCHHDRITMTELFVVNLVVNSHCEKVGEIQRI